MFAHKPPPFSFWYFESLPEKEKADAATKYVQDRYPVGSNIEDAVVEIEQAGMKCSVLSSSEFFTNQIRGHRLCLSGKEGSLVSPFQWGIAIDVEENGNKIKKSSVWRDSLDGVFDRVKGIIHPRVVRENTGMH
jgi:hypothetical protein